MFEMSDPFEGRLDPEYTTAFGRYELAPFNAFPLKRSEPESEFTLIAPPTVVPLFVMMLGTART
jgi:hypothetical protein